MSGIRFGLFYERSLAAVQIIFIFFVKGRLGIVQFFKFQADLIFVNRVNEAISETEFRIPVLYLGELLALSMGMSEVVTANQRRFHRVKLTELLEKIGGAP